jgi:hypothetical protein
MSKKTKLDLFASLKATFALGIQEFSRSLTWTLAKQTTPNTHTADDAKIQYDVNQISKWLDHRESVMQEARF